VACGFFCAIVTEELGVGWLGRKWRAERAPKRKRKRKRKWKRKRKRSLNNAIVYLILLLI